MACEQGERKARARYSYPSQRQETVLCFPEQLFLEADQERWVSLLPPANGAVLVLLLCLLLLLYRCSAPVYCNELYLEMYSKTNPKVLAPKASNIIGNVIIHKSAEIHPTAVVRFPVC